MPVFPEDPEVVLEPAGALAPWQVTRLGLGTHSGTHIDAASHYVPEGTTIDRYPLERFVLPAYVAPVRAAAGEEIALALAAVGPAGRSARRGRAPPHRLGPPLGRRQRRWQHPYLGEDAAAGLVAHGVALVGTDALNVDATEGGTTHAHAALLGADVLIVENLTGLGALTPGRPVHLRLRAAAARRRRRLTHPRLRDRRR